MTAFFTGKGDGGTTKLFDSPKGQKVSKSSPIFETLGMLDELNTLTGWCRAEAQNNPVYGVAGPLHRIRRMFNTPHASLSPRLVSGDDFAASDDIRSIDIGKILLDVQDHLFTLQAEVAGAPKSITGDSVNNINSLINGIEKSLPEVKTFLVPGGTEFSARLDLARAVSRRVERRLVQLHESGERVISDTSRAYANRLSSLFYALVRLENHRAGISERPPQYL